MLCHLWSDGDDYKLSKPRTQHVIYRLWLVSAVTYQQCISWKMWYWDCATITEMGEAKLTKYNFSCRVQTVEHQMRVACHRSNASTAYIRWLKHNMTLQIVHKDPSQKYKGTCAHSGLFLFACVLSPLSLLDDFCSQQLHRSHIIQISHKWLSDWTTHSLISNKFNLLLQQCQSHRCFHVCVKIQHCYSNAT